MMDEAALQLSRLMSESGLSKSHGETVEIYPTRTILPSFYKIWTGTIKMED